MSAVTEQGSLLSSPFVSGQGAPQRHGWRVEAVPGSEADWGPPFQLWAPLGERPVGGGSVGVIRATEEESGLKSGFGAESGVCALSLGKAGRCGFQRRGSPPPGKEE